MRYLLNVLPEKDEQVFQLLEALVQLGALDSFSVLDEGQELAPSVSERIPEYSAEPGFFELESYRDMVD